MKSLVICFFLWIACSVNSKILSPDQHSLIIPSSEHDNEENFAVVVIHELLVQYFSKNCREIGVLALGMPGGSSETMTNKLIKSMPENISVRVMNEESAGKFESSMIVLFDSKQYFKKFQIARKFVSNRGVWHKHLTYVPGLQLQDVMKKFSSSPTISEVNFLVNYDGDSFDLAASFMFTAESCQPNQIKTINRFTRATQRWESSNFYPPKYKNFHGCTIEVHYDDSTMELGEPIYEEIAEQLNFKVERIYEVRRDFHRHEKFSHAMIDKVGIPYSTVTDLVMSSALLTEPLVFVVPPGEPLTDLERMFAAFDGPTWIAIGATFGIALLVIQLIKFMPREVQDFVFGRNIRTPTLNVFSVFLTGVQNRLPGRNFARHLLMMFTMWSMIFRTCYQSMMFEHLNSDLRYPRVKTIDDLNEKNFTFIDTSMNYDILLQTFKFGYNKSFYIAKDTNWFDIVPEPANKLFCILYRAQYIKGFKMNHGQQFLPSTYILDRSLATLPIVMAFPYEVPYSQTFRDKVDEMLANGIVQKLDAETYPWASFEKGRNHYEAEVKPQVLTVESLRFGFLIYLLLLALSFVVFIVELLTGALKIWIISRLASCFRKAHNCLVMQIPAARDGHSRQNVNCNCKVNHELL